jgi:hypothetical protein
MSGKTHVLVQTSPIEVWAQKFKKPKVSVLTIHINTFNSANLAILKQMLRMPVVKLRMKKRKK